MRRILPLAVLALALVGCSSPELQTTDLDVERAFNAARDPWAAPETVVFPSQEYGGANVLRDAGSRTTAYPGVAPRKIARLEIDAALAAGWTVASVACADRPLVTAALTKGEDLDDSALAILSVDGPEALVSLHVPHHLDGSWPATTSVSLDETCLSGGAANESPTDLPFEPFSGDGASPPLDDFEPWQRDTLNDTEFELVARVAADPFIVEIGAEVLEPDLRTGDNWRSGVGASAVVKAASDSTRASVTDVLARSGWTGTWVSCGAHLPTSATARLPVEGGTVVARLTSTTPGEVDIDLSIGVPEAPLSWPTVNDVPALADSRCLGTGDLGSGLTLEGVPVAVPDRIHPYLLSE